MVLLVIKDFDHYSIQMDKKDKTEANFEALFNKLVSKVKEGGEASQLASLIKEYQFSTARTAPLSIKCLNTYYGALLLSHNFAQLRFAIQRYKQVYSDNEVQLYKAIALEAKKLNYAAMLQKTSELEQSSQSQLKGLFSKSIKSFIIKSLAKDYINIEAAYLEKNYGIGKADLERSGCTIDGKFAVLPVSQSINQLDQLVQERIRQLASITQSVVRS